MGLSPWKIKWNQGGPGYWPPKCKNKIRGVQPHMLRKEKIMKIISHPTEGFAKIKSRGSRNKIKKVPSQHPKCSRNKTEGVQGQPMCLWNQLKNAVTTKQSIDSIYSNHTTQQNSTSLGTLDFIFPKIYQIFNPNISKPKNLRKMHKIWSMIAIVFIMSCPPIPTQEVCSNMFQQNKKVSKTQK